MDWQQALSGSLFEALEEEIPPRIAIHNRAQAVKGLWMKSKWGGDLARDITFVMIPENEEMRKKYPVGSFLPEGVVFE